MAPPPAQKRVSIAPVDTHLQPRSPISPLLVFAPSGHTGAGAGAGTGAGDDTSTGAAADANTGKWPAFAGSVTRHTVPTVSSAPKTSSGQNVPTMSSGLGLGLQPVMIPGRTHTRADSIDSPNKHSPNKLDATDTMDQSFAPSKTLRRVSNANVENGKDD